MSGLWLFFVMKIALVALVLGLAVRELWLLRHAKDDPELTRRMLRVFGGARAQARAVPRAPAPAPETEPEPEPLRRAA